MKRGEVHWHRFAAPDKRRPVVVLTRSDLLGHLRTATVAAVTTTIRGVASEVPVGVSEGLPRSCAVNLHNVLTVPKEETGQYLATLSPEVMLRVDRALVFALGVGEGPGPALVAYAKVIAERRDGLPAGAGDVHAVLDQATTRALDDAGGDGQASGEYWS